MKTTHPLPDYLVRRDLGWKATTFTENRSWYRRLAMDGQHSRAMVISCCDSRVHVTSIFGADQGEFFIHRNIANLVPPCKVDEAHHGTSAAVEYAVRELTVAHLIVLGHSNCGGVRRCYDICSGDAPELEAQTSFIGRWMDILCSGFESLAAGPRAARVAALEKAAVTISLTNLMSIPFVAEAVADDLMTLHGLWNDIAAGGLEMYDEESGGFVALQVIGQPGAPGRVTRAASPLSRGPMVQQWRSRDVCAKMKGQGGRVAGSAVRLGSGLLWAGAAAMVAA